MQALDTSVPFVREVFAIVDHGKSSEDAIDVLIAAEQRHGVRIIRDDACGSLATSLAPRDAARRPTMGDFLELMGHWPKQDSASERDAFQALRDAKYREVGDDETSDAALFAFLTDTSFVIGGIDFANDHWIEMPDGIISSWTQRAWGRTLSDWAKTTPLSPWKDLPSGYVTYSFNLHDLIDRYDAWSTAALEVVRQKCARQLEAERSRAIG